LPTFQPFLISFFASLTIDLSNPFSIKSLSLYPVFNPKIASTFSCILPIEPPLAYLSNPLVTLFTQTSFSK